MGFRVSPVYAALLVFATASQLYSQSPAPYRDQPAARAFDSTAMLVAGKAPVVSALALHPEKTILATGGDDHQVRLWSLETGQVLFELKGHTDWVRTVVFSPDGSQLASAGDDHQIRLWNVADGRLLRVFEDYGSAIYSLQFHPTNHTLAAAGFEKTLRIYDVATGKPAQTFPCPCRDMRAVAFSPDGRRLAGGGRNGKIRVWNMDDGSIVDEWIGHRQRIRALAFSPDGGLLASVGEDRAIHLWNVPPTGRATEALALESSGAKLMSLAFVGPHRIATGGSDNIIRVWDLNQGREVTQLVGHTGSVAALVADREGTMLISGGFDTSVRAWAIDSASQEDSTALAPTESELR